MQAVELRDVLATSGSQDSLRGELDLVIEMCTDMLIKREKRWIRGRTHPRLSEFAAVGAGAVAVLVVVWVLVSSRDVWVKASIAVLGFVAVLTLIGMARDLGAIKPSAAAYRNRLDKL